ncbi:MAG: ImmA/IrrE family metallo-endopeptidase [Betaproteobacteria bacterium]|nr:MAG: ImmA/IrrE family metallo-endopeptidase [Betaproteobacteria bacterium]
MDEFQARQRARAFVSGLPGLVAVDLEAYARAANARIRYEALDAGESGYTVSKGTGFVITVSSDESPERQRFTVCHEIAHIILELPSVHGELPSWSFAKRDLNEVWCDIFASELLMPYQHFMQKIPEGDPSVESIETLAQAFGASFPAAASRYASLVSFPCAYVTMDREVVRYAGPNAALRRKGIRMAMKCPIPPGSVAKRLRTAGEPGTAIDQVAQDVWLENCEGGYDLWELSRHYRKHDQTISLLWCSEEELPRGEVDRFNRRLSDDEGGLEELTGVLTWEKHGRRR